MSAGVTYTTFKTKVQQDLDLEEENFIQSSELLGYTNEAIREAEAEINGIYEDYFLDNTPLALVQGTSKYDLPSNIYANKIRGIVYYNQGSSIIYEIKRIRSAKQFIERAMLLYTDPTDYYKYMILNNATTGVQIELSPASKETSSSNVTIWFLRKPAEITTGTDVIPIPEFINFIYAYVKGKCRQKENVGVMPPDAEGEIEKQRALMVSTLSNREPDNDNRVEMDMSFYEESS